MKQAIYLLTVQREMIKTAMNFRRKHLKGLGQKMFDISFVKINQMKNRVELDGMEMIYVTQALGSYAKHLSASSKYIESNHYRILQIEIEELRVNFQRIYGPKVKNEKAASAGTLTA